MREVSVWSKKTTASQIKSGNQLPDLTDSVQLISDRFDEYEKDRKVLFKNKYSYFDYIVSHVHTEKGKKGLGEISNI